MPLETKLIAKHSVTTAAQSVAKRIPDREVRLQLAAASICGSDLHYYLNFANGSYELRRPVTQGHEACAYVIDPNGSDLKEGQLVVMNPIINCESCPACLAGEENHCAAKEFPGSAISTPRLDGFFREIIDHPARCCRPADGADPRHLTFTEPLACALHCLNTAGLTAENCPGQQLLVVGCGSMGLLAIAAAAERGGEVTAIDPNEKALATAASIGARHILPASQQTDTKIADQFDVVIEASGAPAAFGTALSAVRRKGRVVVLSFLRPQAAQNQLDLITFKEVQIQGSFQFRSIEFEQAAVQAENSRIDFAALTAASFPLAEVGEALELMTAGEFCGKILLSPE